ncbi:MAG TPA: helix-turn-helix domain-containing protein [Steroidobacteraceae bacterium]|nr:helix-turn-helix domain-containing protein [Steroidobacteraceae bacterium]
MSVLESEACKSLDHAAFKILVILAAHYRGRNNGTQAITGTFAHRFGFKGRNTVYRSLRALVERGLLIQTRDGWRQKDHFALYAIGWEDITHRDGKPLDKPEPRNNTKWLNWTQMRTHGGESTVPMVGNDRAVCVPTMGTREPDCVPTMGNTLRLSDGSPTGTAGTSRSRPRSAPVSRGSKKLASLLQQTESGAARGSS